MSNENGDRSPSGHQVNHKLTESRFQRFAQQRRTIEAGYANQVTAHGGAEAFNWLVCMVVEARLTVGEVQRDYETAAQENRRLRARLVDIDTPGRIDENTLISPDPVIRSRMLKRLVEAIGVPQSLETIAGMIGEIRSFGPGC